MTVDGLPKIDVLLCNGGSQVNEHTLRSYGVLDGDVLLLSRYKPLVKREQPILA